MSEYGQLKDFENLLRNITSGKIPPRNICWLLNLHLGSLTSLTSTTAMRWDMEIVEFFQLFTCYLELLRLMFYMDQCTSVKLLWKMLNEGSSTQEVQKLIFQSHQSELCILFPQDTQRKYPLVLWS